MVVNRVISMSPIDTTSKVQSVVSSNSCTLPDVRLNIGAKEIKNGDRDNILKTSQSFRVY